MRVRSAGEKGEKNVVVVGVEEVPVHLYCYLTISLASSLVSNACCLSTDSTLAGSLYYYGDCWAANDRRGFSYHIILFSRQNVVGRKSLPFLLGF